MFYVLFCWRYHTLPVAHAILVSLAGRWWWWWWWLCACVCACVWPIWGHCFGFSGVRGCECVWPIWGPWLAGWSPRWSSPSSARGGGGGRVWRGVAPCQALSFTTLVSPWSTSFSFSLSWLTVWSFHLGLLRGDRQRIGSLLLPILVGHVLWRGHGGAALLFVCCRSLAVLRLPPPLSLPSSPCLCHMPATLIFLGVW